MTDEDKEKLDKIIQKYDGKEGFLIQLLLDLQSELHWISQERYASRKRDVSVFAKREHL